MTGSIRVEFTERIELNLFTLYSVTPSLWSRLNQLSKKAKVCLTASASGYKALLCHLMNYHCHAQTSLFNKIQYSIILNDYITQEMTPHLVNCLSVLIPNVKIWYQIYWKSDFAKIFEGKLAANLWNVILMFCHLWYCQYVLYTF